MAGSRVSAEELEARFTPELALHGFDLVEVEVLRGGGRLTLRFAIDKDGGVNVDDCAAVDRAISRLLEADEEELGRYVVEVSSPGIFRRLKRPDHYRRFLGEWVKATYAMADSEDTRQIRGRLVDVDELAFTIEPEEGERESVSFAAVRNTHLDPDLRIGSPKKTSAPKRREKKWTRKGS